MIIWIIFFFGLTFAVWLLFQLSILINSSQMLMSLHLINLYKLNCDVRYRISKNFFVTYRNYVVSPLWNFFVNNTHVSYFSGFSNIPKFYAQQNTRYYACRKWCIMSNLIGCEVVHLWSIRDRNSVDIWWSFVMCECNWNYPVYYWRLFVS